jgi:hypothetical protein
VLGDQAAIHGRVARHRTGVLDEMMALGGSGAGARGKR